MSLCIVVSVCKPLSCCTVACVAVDGEFGSFHPGAVMEQLQRLVALMSLSQCKILAPNEFKSSMPEYFRNGVQQDATEFSKVDTVCLHMQMYRMHL